MDGQRVGQRVLTIPPDTKDWTWTVTSRCPECGYDGSEVSVSEVPELTRDYAEVLAAAVRAPGSGERPSPLVWSPLEYGCHVRDVCSIFVARVSSMLSVDDPVFANWDQDEAAVSAAYAMQRPGLVAGQLIAAADVIADRFASVPASAWSRLGRRSNGSVFTVETLAIYFLHDLAHHVWDVTAAR